MSPRAVTHIALRVERLREAEVFYRELFGLQVAFREAETREGWDTLPAEKSWDDVERAGIELGLVMLYRDAFRLALEAVDSVTKDGQLSHIGVLTDPDELARLRKLVASAGLEVAADREQALVFDDPFGVRWELNTFPYDDPQSLSTGARLGRWLDVEPKAPE